MRTLSKIVSPPRRKGSKPALFVGLNGDDPRSPPARIALAGFDQVLLGRGPRALTPGVSDGAKQLVVALADARMSSQHAKLVRTGASWAITDLGSKNGTWVGAEQVTTRPLEDGDTIIVGHTAIVYREYGGELGDWQGTPSAAHPNLATFAAESTERFTRLVAASTSKVPIELTGESGTGKELAAQAVHALSGRAGPFVAFNCGSLSQTLLEAELFGHTKGAFTNAVGERAGLVRTADRGTLFLDEVAELPASSQAALLRVLQEGEVLPVGADKPIKVDVRIVTATLKDLQAEVEAKRFREDLRARLLGVRVAMPPLRERREDLGWLVPLLLHRAVPDRKVTFSVDTLLAIYTYEWPLNIRELERTLAAACAIAGERIEMQHLPEQMQADAARPTAPSESVAESDPSELSEEDKQLAVTVQASIERHRGNLSAVARELGKDRRQIQRWVKRFSLTR